MSDEGTPIVSQGDHLADLGMGGCTVVSITYTEKAKALPCQLTFQFPVSGSTNIQVDVGGRPGRVEGREPEEDSPGEDNIS